MADLDLPQSVLELVEFSPIEEVMLAVLHAGLPDVPSFSLIPEDVPDYFVLVRRLPGYGTWGGDPRFIDAGRLFIHVFTCDPDGDEKGARLSEAVRVVLRNANRDKPDLGPLGSISSIEMDVEPSRKTDWANSSGPVQFADLPTGFWRYEAVYVIKVRKP